MKPWLLLTIVAMELLAASILLYILWVLWIVPR